MTDSHKLPTSNLPQNTTLSTTQNTDEVSVMRHAFLGSSFCKAKAKQLTSPGKVYEGLAVLSAFQIRSTGCDIADSRHVYLGHADINVGIDVPARRLDPTGALFRRTGAEHIANTGLAS